MLFHRLWASSATALLGLAGGAAGAADYPVRPLRIIVPWVAGGGTDIVARILAPKLIDTLGQQLVIDNRPGANGIIGAEVAAKAAPDGHTMVLHAVEHFINGSVQPRLNYDTVKDFAPVSLIAAHALVLIVQPLYPAASPKDLAALAKAKPGQLSFGSWGDGSLAHLSGELFKHSAALQMTHIPYKGAPQAALDVIAGRVPFMFVTMPVGAPHVKAGKVKALAVTSAKRQALIHEAPTMIEAGYAGFQVDSWRGMYVPAGTPQYAVTRLNRELVKIMQISDVRSRINASGFDPLSSTPEELDAFGRAEFEKWAKVVKTAGIRAE
jgi:tripartite-type tricarboxylate transporter receptor subunit TctC